MPPVRLLALPLLVLTAGCAPSLTPLYRDFEIRSPPADTADVHARIRAGLRAAGWTLAEADAPEAIGTAPRTISDVVLYRTEVHLDVIPIGGRHVRVFVHPYRRYATGGRAIVPYLSTGLSRRILPPLRSAFREQGLVSAGLPRDQDRPPGD